MKILQLTLRAASGVCLAAILSSASCELFDKIEDIKFDAKIPVVLTVNETTVSTTAKTYTKSQVLDPTTNADVAKYKSKIKELTVKSITVKISDYGPAGSTVKFTNGKITTSTGKLIASVPDNIDLKGTSEVTLTADDAGLAELSTLLAGAKSETVNLTGTFSSTPVTFKITITFETLIAAGVL